MSRTLKTIFQITILSTCALARAQDPVASAPRGEINLNGAWQYQINSSTTPPTSGWLATRIPAQPITDGTVAVWYQDSVYVPAAWLVSGRRWFLNFDQVGHYAAVYLNGQMVGTNYGQFVPFQIEITSSVLVGNNLVQVYAHQSDSTYAYPGSQLNQSGCAGAGLPANCQALSYRPAAGDPVSRNWVGIAGDVSLSWRPASYVQSVITVPSVRNMALSAVVQVAGSGTFTLQSTVLDGSSTVLTLPATTVQGGASTTIQPTPWSNPVLWGPPGYGSPKLYTLQTQLWQGSQLVDTEFDRFGFREVWFNGPSLMLNGLPLHAVGDYNFSLVPLRVANDRRPLAAQVGIYQASGLNMFVDHWDQDPVAYGLADEMGMLIEGAFYCNGALPQAQADNATTWTDTMVSTTAAWVQKYANHPSVVIWRPVDVMPEGISRSVAEPQIAAAVAANDPQGRPIADDGTLPQSITFLAQAGDGSEPGTCGDLSSMQSTLAGATGPVFVKEVYAGQNLPCSPAFFTQLYGFITTYASMVGFIPQSMNFNTQVNFNPSWASQSGIGNRPTTQQVSLNGMLPNWLGSWTPTAFSTQFASLDPQPITLTYPTSGDFETTAASGATLAVMAPANGLGSPSGVTVDGGSAWWVTPWTGSSNATYYDNNGNLLSTVPVTVSAPGPVVGLSPASLSFGSQQVQTSSSGQAVTLTNTGIKTLNITTVTIGPDYTETNTCGTSVVAGTSCAFSVTFAPTTTGTLNESLTIADNASDSPQTVSLSGTGVAPAVTLSSGSLAFGNQVVGTSSGAQAVTLTNSGTATLTVTSITVTGTNSGDFTQTNTCGTSVAAGASCTVSVTFTPSISGAESASVSITDNATGSPQTVSLSGTGVPATAPAVSLSPSSLSFGYEGIGTSSAIQTVTLTNSGTAPFPSPGLHRAATLGRTIPVGRRSP